MFQVGDKVTQVCRIFGRSGALTVIPNVAPTAPGYVWVVDRLGLESYVPAAELERA